MGGILIQTQDVIDKLKSVGLKRHEFRARCERLMNGRTFCGYGDVQITLLCSIERQQELAPRLAEHFRVVRYVDNGKPRGTIDVYEKGQGLIEKEW